MRPAKKKTDDSKSSVPAYIVTFSDMVTLLLTFFVLLLSLAEKRDAGLLQKGRDSFKRAIADFGLSGLLFNKDVNAQFSHPRIKYKIDKGEDEPEDRSIDLATEIYRRLLEEIEQMMKIMPSQITCTEKTFHITDISFSDGDWTLNSKGMSYLDSYVGQLRESFVQEKPILYVVGLAGNEPGEKQQWLVSARRSQAVADHIKRALGDNAPWTVYNWGAGSGGVWTGQSGMFSTKMQIAIAVLTDEERTGN